MSTEEIQNFWMRYSTGRAFSRANANIPDWKTRQQLKYFLHSASSYYYQPIEKDVNGKYIINRSDLVNHIVAHLKDIIKKQIQSDIEFKNRPLLDKLPFYLIVFSLVLVPFFLIGSLTSNKVGHSIVVTCYIIYLVNFILYLIIQLITRYMCRQQADDK